MIFKELNKEKINILEDKVSNFWEEIDILNKQIEIRKDSNPFVFYEGPPTANGMPGVHHVMARVLKDTICKYKSMSGYKVLRKAGWDTHGLPVELEVEKALGLSSKKDIEEYGILEFNQKCRESVWKNEKAFNEMTKRMGYFLDLKNPYITYDNKFIETQWHILDKFFKEGLMYEGHKILPYCSRCGTGLASHEVAQGYKEIKTDTVTVKMKLVDENAYLLVWTTTPWTLMSNVAVCVNPNEIYVKVKAENENYIVAKTLADSIFEEYEVLEEYKGTDLEHKKYEQLMNYLEVKDAFYIICDEYVTTSDGTGLVHIAPAFGEDDLKAASRYKLPVVNPVSEDGKYIEGPWTGMFVMNADPEIIVTLKEEGKLFKKQRMAHNYPHCWRCKTPLLYYTKPSWYIKMTALKDKLIENNKTVNWYPSFTGEKRFGNWLENLNDWAISRNRYWGTPLNIWNCECGHMKTIGSKKELVELAIEDIDETIELHRPFIDDVHIKCDKCQKSMTRVKDVIDCWFDSGSMPFAQHHYPFENKEMFETQFPADYICEGIDQTRGWFYSLLAISTFMTGKAPYKNVLVNDLLLDKNGQKMSKSRGNGVDPFKLFDEYGADVVRFYLLHVSPCWTTTKFDEEGLKEINSKFFSTLKNTYTFFTMYANIDLIDPKDFNIDYNERPLIDKWILSRYNTLIKNVTDSLNEFDMTKSVRFINSFVNDDLSNWYIRRNRNRFWSSNLDLDKKSVYKTTYEVLVGLCKLSAPFIPFITETMYQNLTGNLSVHLEDFPVTNKNLIDEKLEEEMNLVRDLISLGRQTRENTKIKVRQPISEIILDNKYKKSLEKLENLIFEELNVKKITYKNNLSVYMNFEFKPNFKIAGKVFGSKIKDFSTYLSNMTHEKYESINELEITLDNDTFTITKEFIDVKINAQEDFDISMEDGKFVILNTTLTEELILEGIARELISKVQNIRKAKDFEIMDKIKIYYNEEETFTKVLKLFSDLIKEETLCNKLILNKKILETVELNSIKVGINIEKYDL